MDLQLIGIRGVAYFVNKNDTSFFISFIIIFIFALLFSCLLSNIILNVFITIEGFQLGRLFVPK